MDGGLYSLFLILGEWLMELFMSLFITQSYDISREENRMTEITEWEETN